MQTFLNSRLYPWIIWGLGAFLFFSEYFVRTSSSVMVGDLMRAFHVDALGIGVIAVCFYYPYTLMQIPVGLLMDRYGPSRLLALMALVFSLGCFVFASTHSLWVAECARVMMGISAAFAFVGTLKLVTLWFDMAQIGFLAGLTQALGMFGAAIGEGPVAHLVHIHGWRTAMGLMGGFILLLCVLLASIIRPHPSQAQVKHNQQSWRATWRAVIGNDQTWKNALFAGLLYAPTLAFGELWGVSYLEKVHHLTHQDAASAMSWIFLGWAVGGPLLGKWSDVIQKRKPMFYLSAGLSLLWMACVLYMPHLSAIQIGVCLFLYGISNTGLVVSYALSGELNAPHQTGTTMAITNMASVLLGTCCQPLIGWLLVHHHVHHVVGMVHHYTASDYRFAMACLPLIFLISIGVAMMVKETHCQRQGQAQEGA